MSKLLSIVVPCYNEVEALPIFYDAITHTLSSVHYDYELLFINDGSTDDTINVMKNLAAKDNHVKYYSFSRNFGKESAMYAGFCNADGAYVAVMDVDMQDPPSLLPEMLQIIESGKYDCVATTRVTRKGEPPIRSFFARRFYKIINKISDANLVDGARDFRLMRREMVDVIVEMGEYSRFSKGIFGSVGFKTYWLQYENIERVAGETKWHFWKLFKYAIDGIVNFSQVPLSIASWLGVGMTAVSFIMLLVIIIKKLAFDILAETWTSLACIIIFIGGCILLCLGIMGQYIAKIFIETKQRPHYIITDTNSQNVIKIK